MLLNSQLFSHRMHIFLLYTLLHIVYEKLAILLLMHAYYAIMWWNDNTTRLKRSEKYLANLDQRYMFSWSAIKLFLLTVPAMCMFRGTIPTAETCTWTPKSTHFNRILCCSQTWWWAPSSWLEGWKPGTYWGYWGESQTWPRVDGTWEWVVSAISWRKCFRWSRCISNTRLVSAPRLSHAWSNHDHSG